MTYLFSSFALFLLTSAKSQHIVPLSEALLVLRAREAGHVHVHKFISGAPTNRFLQTQEVVHKQSQECQFASGLLKAHIDLYLIFI
jgi:hypothetical protein